MAILRNELKNELRAYVRDGISVTPSDTVDLTVGDALIYVGGAGSIKLKLASGNDVTFSEVPAGMFMPVLAKRVFSTGTTATNILALY